MRPEKDRVWKPRIRPADVPLIIRDLHHTRKASAGHLFTPPSKDRTHVKRHAELYNFIRERAARIDREQKAAIKANPDTLDTVDSGTFLFRFNSKIAVQGDVFLCDGLWRRQRGSAQHQYQGQCPHCDYPLIGDASQLRRAESI